MRTPEGVDHLRLRLDESGRAFGAEGPDVAFLHAELRDANRTVLAEAWENVSFAATGDLELIGANPFRSRAHLRLELPEDSQVDVRIHDVSGRSVVVLSDRMLPAGRHRITWDGRDGHGAQVASGVYFVRLTCDGETATRRLALVR